MAITQTTIRVRWDGYEPDAIGNSPILGFRLCISNNNRNFNCIDLAEDVREHTFTSLAPNTTYYLTLQGFNEIGESDAVKLVGTTLDTVTEAPDAPSVAVRQSDEDEALVTTTVSDFESKEVDSVEIQKSTDSSTWSALATVTSVDEASVSHFDENLTAGSTYYYRARAVNRVGASAWSSVVSILIEDCDNRCGVISNINVRFEDATPEQKRSGSWILASADEDFCGPYRECPPEPVSKPRDLSVTNIRHNAASATWRSPLQTGGYDILKYVVNFGEGDVDIASTSAELENLKPATNYTLSVKAVNFLGTVSLAAEASFTTAAAPPPEPKAKPNAPNIDSVSLNDDDKAVIVFDQSTDRANKPVEQYKFYERTSGGDVLLRTLSQSDFAAEFDISTVVSQTKTYTAAGTYRFFMRAANSDQESNDSNVVHLTIDAPEPQVPHAPGFNYIVVDTNGQVRLGFSYVQAGPAATSFRVYEVLANDVLRETFEAEAFLPGQTRKLVDETLSRSYLTPGTYSFYVVAVNEAGESDRSSVLSFTVVANRKPSAPRNLRFRTVTAIDKVFDWDAPLDRGHPNFTRYEFVLETASSNVADVRYSSTNRIRVQNLLYNTTYTARVIARNSEGFSVSNRISFTTEEGRPTPPRNLRLSLVDEVNVRARWDVPTSPNGRISFYTLYYRELFSGANWSQVNVAGNLLSTVIGNLERGLTYEFEITATTTGGRSLFTNTPQRITIPDFEKPGSVGLACSLQGDDFVLNFAEPTETGGADLFKYRVAVTVPGQLGVRYLEYSYPQRGSVVVQEDIKTLFGLSVLPSGTYSFAASVRNEELDEYSDVIAISRCSLNYTMPVGRPKGVTDITFSRPSNVLVVTFKEPTDTGVYQFDVFVEVRGNTRPTYSAQQTRFRQQTPDGETKTFTTAIASDVFDDRTITARIISSKVGTLETTTVTKTQVYEDVVGVPNAPHVKRANVYSDNVARIVFDHPVGHEPVESFKIYEALGDGSSVLKSTLNNIWQPDTTNITQKVSSQTYTAPGTYSFYVTSVNSAGESPPSNVVSFTIEPPPPPPPPPKPSAARLFNVRKGLGNDLVFVWAWPTGRGVPTNLKFYEAAGSPGVSSDTLLENVDVSGVTSRRSIVTTVTTTRARTVAGTYSFYAVANNAQGDAPKSNYVTLTVAEPPPAVPDAPILRRVERTDNNNPRFVFDYPTSGSTPTEFRFYQADGLLLQRFEARSFRRGQTSIENTVTLFAYASVGTHNFFMRAYNDVGESPNSETKGFTVEARQQLPSAPVLNSALFDDNDNSLTIGYDLNDVPPNVTGIKVRVANQDGVSMTRTINFDEPVSEATTDLSRKITNFVSSADGTYYVSIVAFNSFGDGPGSNVVSYLIDTTISTTPLAPVLLSARALWVYRNRARLRIRVSVPNNSPDADYIRFALAKTSYVGYGLDIESRTAVEGIRTYDVTFAFGSATTAGNFNLAASMSRDGVHSPVSNSLTLYLGLTGFRDITQRGGFTFNI